MATSTGPESSGKFAGTLSEWLHPGQFRALPARRLGALMRARHDGQWKRMHVVMADSG
jgi:hypothetical protein